MNYYEKAKDHIIGVLRTRFPDLNLDSGSAARTVLADGAALFMEPVMQELDHVNLSRDLSADLGDADVDRILENLLIERDQGEKASGFVRFYYHDRGNREFVAGIQAQVDDLIFETTAPLSFPANAHKKDQLLELYYISVPFSATEPGAAYNIEAGALTVVNNDTSGASMVKNTTPFSGGANKQDNDAAIKMAKAAVSTRTPWNNDGAEFWLRQKFGSALKSIVVIGHGHPKMSRDEMFDMGTTNSPRFAIGVSSLNQNREQAGTASGIHVGGRTDVYIRFNDIDFTRQVIDIFADTTLDFGVTAGPLTSISATFVEGTTGTVADSGKLIIDAGGAGTETIEYISCSTVDGNTYVFIMATGVELVSDHAAGQSVKVVNNNKIAVGTDIPVKPVYRIKKVVILDPVTYAPMQEIPEASGRMPGWKWGDVSRYDFMSAREVKTLILYEASDIEGNQEQAGPCTTSTSTEGVIIEAPSADFTGCAGRTITLSEPGEVDRAYVITDVMSETEVLIFSNVDLSSIDSFKIDSLIGDYIQYPVQVDFYTHQRLAAAQFMFDEDDKRAQSGDMLARDFLPKFLDFKLRYRGDVESSTVASTIYKMMQESESFEYSDIIASAYDAGAEYVETPFEIKIRTVGEDGTMSTAYINPGNESKKTAVISEAPSVNFLGTSEVDYVTNTIDMISAELTKGRVVIVEGHGEDRIEIALTRQVFGNFSADLQGLQLDILATTRILKVSCRSQIIAPGLVRLGAYGDEVHTYSNVVATSVDDEYLLVLDSGLLAERNMGEAVVITSIDYDPDIEITDGKITVDDYHTPEYGDVEIMEIS